MYKAQVFITLKPSVLDPQGGAIMKGIETMGFKDISNVRVGKYLELTLDVSTQEKAHEQMEEICKKLLSNPVLEDYRFELVEV